LCDWGRAKSIKQSSNQSKNERISVRTKTIKWIKMMC
jgi:hypothetical protein